MEYLWNIYGILNIYGISMEYLCLCLWKIYGDIYGISMIIHDWLVVSTPLKHMKVNWDDYFIDMEKQNSCSKPPTSHGFMVDIS